MPAWLPVLLGLAWLVLFRIRLKRGRAVGHASISAGSVRDLGGRGGF